MTTIKKRRRPANPSKRRSPVPDATRVVVETRTEPQEPGLAEEPTLAEKTVFQKVLSIPFLGEVIAALVFGAPSLALYWVATHVFGISGGLKRPGWLFVLWAIGGVWAIWVEELGHVRLVTPGPPIPLKWFSPVMMVYAAVKLVGAWISG